MVGLIPELVFRQSRCIRESRAFAKWWMIVLLDLYLEGRSGEEFGSALWHVSELQNRYLSSTSSQIGFEQYLRAFRMR